MIFGFMRVKNEARWIRQVIAAIQPVCTRVFVLDDHSDDGTDSICEGIPGVVLVRSPFTGLDETRDKNYLLNLVVDALPDPTFGPTANNWCLAIDGDELLDQLSLGVLTDTLETSYFQSFRLPVRYLWNSNIDLFPNEMQIRVDGIYANFSRPSVFRINRRNLAFRSTGCGGNLHCSSVPLEMIEAGVCNIDVPLWHLGYNFRSDRIRKFNWYNAIDPRNFYEDQYRHCVQGDVPEVPADAQLVHAGPLQLKTIRR